MGINKERAFELLKKMSFERIAGTEKELECANILKQEIEKEGVNVEIEEFEIDSPEIYKTSFKVTKPVEYEINCEAIGKSGNTPDEGITAPLYYVENGMDANLLDVKGKIALLTGGAPETIDKLKDAGALAYIQVDGSLFDSKEMITEIRKRHIRKKLDENYNFPGIIIHITDAEKLLRLNPKEVNIVVKQDCNKKAISHNVVATILGTEKEEEIITLTAHYDSVIYSPGAWDNATGSVTIMELFHYFIENKPKRTLKFIWCGSEEIGLIGSYNYCEKHKEEIKKYLFNINVDMTGVLLGYDIAVCSCDESVAKYIDFIGKIEGFAIKTSIDMYPSDSSPFAMNDIPAVTFARLAPHGGAEIHSRNDVLNPLDPDKFINTVDFMIKFAEKIINSKVFPVSKEFPKELKEKIEQFKKRFNLNKEEESKK